MPIEAQSIGLVAQSTSSKNEENSRPRWREAVAAGLYQSGALRILQAISRRYELAPKRTHALDLRLRRARSAKFAILCYHRIGTGGIPLFSDLAPEVFDAQMRFLRCHLRVISLDALVEEMHHPGPGGQAVAVTFDDGYRDLHTFAMPILARYQIPATIFLPVASIETGTVPWYDRIFLLLKVLPEADVEIHLDGVQRFRLASYRDRLKAATEIVQYLRTVPDCCRKEHCERLEKLATLPEEELRDRMLSWDQIRAMSRAGVTFGSHTMTHPVVSQLAETQLNTELRESKQILEQRIASSIHHFAFPFGKPADCGQAALPVLARSGYRSASTTVEGTNSPGDNPYELCRTQVGNERSLAMFAYKLNELFFNSACEDSSASSALFLSPRHSRRVG